jgi:fatty-acyl-CoA synthase
MLVVGTTWNGFGRATFNPYGLTETYGPVALGGAEDPPDVQDQTCGRFFDVVEHRIVDPATGADLGPGQVGEIVVRGMVMRGYYNLPAEMGTSVDADGWFHTQDLGSVDEHGYLSYLGRQKAMPKVGGENVGVEEVENVILSMPGVAECALVGVRDERLDRDRARLPRDDWVRGAGCR